MSIEIGEVDEATRQAVLGTLIEHAADPDEPGAWIAETARHLLTEADPTRRLAGYRYLTRPAYGSTVAARS